MSLSTGPRWNDASPFTAADKRPRRAEWAIAISSSALYLFLVLIGAYTGLASPILAIGLAALVVWIAWQDLRTFTIPDGAVAAIAALAISSRWSLAIQAGDPPLETGAVLAFDAIASGGLLLAFREIYFRRHGFDGIGLGDIKLAAAGAVLVGTVGFSWALFAASLTGLVWFGVRRILPQTVATPKGTGPDRIAFGALLAPAFWMVWMAQKMAVLPLFAWR